MGHNQSTEHNNGGEEQGHDQPVNQVGDMAEGQAPDRENTEERSNVQDQPIDIIVTDMSSQNIDSPGASAANEGTASTATVSNEASSGLIADQEVRRGRQMERTPQPLNERVPYGEIINTPLARVAGRARQKNRSKGRVRDRRANQSENTPEGSTSRGRSRSRLGPREGPSNDASAGRDLKQGVFNVIPPTTNAKSTGTSSETSDEPKKMDKGKQRAIEVDPAAENPPARRKSLESLDLQRSRQSNTSSYLSRVFGNSSNAGPSNVGPSNAGPSNTSSSNAGPSSAAPSSPPHSTSLTRSQDSSSTTASGKPKIHLQEARKFLLKCMADPDFLKRSRVSLKNYPFSKEAAEAYSEIVTQRLLLEDANALLKAEIEKNDDITREKSNLSKSWENCEQNVEQLQMALENEIEEKDALLAEAERRRKNVSDASVQTDISRGTHRTEADVVSSILAKHKNRLAAARPSTSAGVGRQVDWSRLAPKSWGAQGSRIRRLLHAHAENSDSNNGDHRDDSHGNVSGAAPRLPLFTFEMHGQHENACEVEEKNKRTKTEK